MLTVRLVFCLYAEDANLFKPDALRDYVAASTPERLGEDLYDLFEASLPAGTVESVPLRGWWPVRRPNRRAPVDRGTA